ncbi:MAG: hypothetical protein HY429_02985 [Candidatus Levybacteria bacterium]|nr:hypothetical protein [Candidatus Levybacteria bacterium]
MRRFSYVLILSFAALLEGMVTALPLLLVALILLYTIKKDTMLFSLAFIFGFLLDVANVDNIGYRSLFFTLTLFIIFSYERKFEVQTASFIFFASLIGAISYIFTFSENTNIFLPSFATATLSLVLFAIITKLDKRYFIE